MRSAVTLAIVISMVLSLVSPALAQSGGGWLGWLQQLRQWIDQVLRVVDRIRGIATSTGAWWEYAVPQISTVLGRSEVDGVLSYLLSMAGRVPSTISGWIQALVNQILGQASSSPSPGTASESLKKVAELNPAIRRGERGSLGRQVQAVRLVAESEAVQNQTEEIANQLASSTATDDAAAAAMENADRLQQSVMDAQSSRALLQYLGEGIADLMRQQATFPTIIARHLAALSQQQALSNRELQLVVTALAQQLLDQERERRARALATQQALQSAAEGYAKSVESVGIALSDLQQTSSDRKRAIEEAITPR